MGIVEFELPPIGLGCANLLQCSLPEFIEIAGRAGFERITVRPYAFAEALEIGRTESVIRQLLADQGLTVTMVDALTSAMPGTPSPHEIDPTTLARLPPDVLDPPTEEMCFRTCSALGSPLLNVTHYLGRALPPEVLAESLAGVCRRAAPLGVTLCVEFIRESGIPDLTTARAVVEACGEPNCTVLLDLFHLDRSGGTEGDVLRLPSGSIGGIQLSDRTRSFSGTPHVALSGRRLPGEGELPLVGLVKAGLENNPAASLDIEVLNDELRSLPPQEAANRLAAAARRWKAFFEEEVTATQD